MADARTQALAKELAKGHHDADDLPNLARNVYVRCLLKVHSAGGRSEHAKTLALTVAGEVMKEIVGMHFGPADVQTLLDEQKRKDNGEPSTQIEHPEPKSKVLDPYDLGM